MAMPNYTRLTEILEGMKVPPAKKQPENYDEQVEEAFTLGYNQAVTDMQTKLHQLAIMR